MKRYQAIARFLLAKEYSEKKGNADMAEHHWSRAVKLLDGSPSGSGWDEGTTLSEDSRPDRLVFWGSYHHMDENGFYDRWTSHEIVVTPSLAFGLEIRVTGRDHNDVKEYLAEIFDNWLQEEVKQ